MTEDESAETLHVFFTDDPPDDAVAFVRSTAVAFMAAVLTRLEQAPNLETAKRISEVSTACAVVLASEFWPVDLPGGEAVK